MFEGPGGASRERRGWGKRGFNSLRSHICRGLLYAWR